MNCPVCGSQYPCTHTNRKSAVGAARTHTGASGRVAAGSGGSTASPAERQQWRNEIISRVQARRRKHDPDSLEFDFPPAESSDNGFPEAESSRDQFVTHEVNCAEPGRTDFSRDSDTTGPEPFEPSFHPLRAEPPKVIRFPRFAAALAPIAERLGYAETALPVNKPPRITEAQDPVIADELPDPRADDEDSDEPFSFTTTPVPQQPPAEQLQLLPNFEDIHLEDGHQRQLSEQEIIPQAAPLPQRAIAMIVDLGIVLLAGAIFAATFSKLAEDSPSSRIAFLCAMGVAGLLWLVYQYMFLVYGRGTPGMRFAELELSTFEGKRLSERHRRSRALASMVSAFSLGLGYAWTLVDEDQLSWHDRITQTIERSRYQRVPRRSEDWIDRVN